MNKGRLRTLAPGIVFLALCAALVAFYREGIIFRFGVASGFVGIFLVFISFRYRVPEAVAGRIGLSSTVSLARMLEGLRLEGQGVFLPPVGDDGQSLVFVPLHARTPTLSYSKFDPHAVYITEQFASDHGVLVRSPGADLVTFYEEQTGVSFSEVGGSEAAAMLSIMQGLDLVSSLDADFDEGRLKVTFTHASYGDMCDRVRSVGHDVCLQAGCPLCGSILSAVAKAEGRPIRVTSIERTDRVVLKAEVMEWQR
jgi:hypothetical protein